MSVAYSIWKMAYMLTHSQKYWRKSFKLKIDHYEKLCYYFSLYAIWFCAELKLGLYWISLLPNQNFQNYTEIIFVRRILLQLNVVIIKFNLKLNWIFKQAYMHNKCVVIVLIILVHLCFRAFSISFCFELDMKSAHGIWKNRFCGFRGWDFIIIAVIPLITKVHITSQHTWIRSNSLDLSRFSPVEIENTYSNICCIWDLRDWNNWLGITFCTVNFARFFFWKIQWK